MKWIYSVLLVLLAFAGTPGSAQWEKRLDPAVPRTRDGKLDLAARPPRARDGKVDLSGGSASKRRKSSRPPLFHRRHGGPQARGCPNPTLGHGAAQRARRRPRETKSVFAMPAYGRAGRRHRSTSVEDHPNASGHRDPLRGEQHFPADLSGWPSAPEGSRLQMDGLFRSDGGKAIRLLSTAADSGMAVGSTVWAIHTAPICT